MACALKTTRKKFLKSCVHVDTASVSAAEPLLPGRTNEGGTCGTSLFSHLEIMIYFLLSKSLALHFSFLLFYPL